MIQVMATNQNTPNRMPAFVIMAIGALALGAAANWLLGEKATSRPEMITATVLYEQARPLPEFSLLQHRGQPFSRSDLTGKWSFLFFGYTHCPDICPTTLLTLNDAVQRMRQKGNHKDTQVIFVSVDPDRDDVKRLSEYVPFYNQDFIGLTGTHKEIGKFAHSMGVVRAKIAVPEDPENYLVDHSSAVILVGPEARMEAYFGAPHDAAIIAGDFHKIRDYFERN